MLRETAKWKNHKAQSIDAERRGGIICSSDEAAVMAVERRGYIVQLRFIKQPEMEGLNEYNKVVWDSQD